MYTTYLFYNSASNFAPMAVADGPAIEPRTRVARSKGLPCSQKGIIEQRSRSSKLQARLSYKGEDGKTIEKFIPGLFAV